jgi:hypothetical protein
LIQELQADTDLYVRGVKADADKLSRAAAVTPAFETHKVFFIEDECKPLIEELSVFPAGGHDDLVDALVHGLNYLRTRRSEAMQYAKAMAKQPEWSPITSPLVRAYNRGAVVLHDACIYCNEARPGVDMTRLPDGRYAHKECEAESNDLREAVRRADEYVRSRAAEPAKVIPLRRAS